MEPGDCTWCGSAQSIEYGVCQVCLMRFSEGPEPEPQVVIELREPGAKRTEKPEDVERSVAGTAAD